MNQEIFFSLNSLAGQWLWLDYLIIFLAQYLGWFLVLGIFEYLYWKRAWPDLLRVFGSAGVAWLASEIIKFIFPSPRPFEVLENISQLVSHGGLDSFPSAHAAIFFALATAVWFVNKKLSIVFFIGAVLISLARVSSGIHWPIDTFAGAIMGILIAVIINQFAARDRMR